MTQTMTYATSADLCKMFDRSYQTIMLWRQKQGLPHKRFPGNGRDMILFDLEEVRQWAKDNGKQIRN